MAKMDAKSREVLDRAEWVTIATWSDRGPHLVGTWGDYVREMGIRDDEVIVIPAGGYRTTEENLKKNDCVVLLVASKQVQGTNSMGQGYRITGRGELQTEGRLAEEVKAKFSWARGALVVRMEEFSSLL